MSYLHIGNLYKERDILLFRECFALEKIHGTSAHVAWKDGAVRLFSGGEEHARFVGLFDVPALSAAFAALGHPAVVVYGEAYGGSQQGQSWRYGKALRFVAFDVKVGDLWLAVPDAEQVASALGGLEFVAYDQIQTDLAAIDAARDAPSVQAKRNGVEGDVPREGVVLRPPIELRKNNGDRIIAKHKRDEERETKEPRSLDPEKLRVLEAADAIADEWVTETRLSHVLDKLPGAGIERMGEVIRAMVEDVQREGAGEFVDLKDARRAIGKRAAQMFKERLKASLREGS